MNHMVQSLLKVDLKPQYSIRPSTAGVLFLQAVHAGRIKKVERDLVRVDPKKDQLLLIGLCVVIIQERPEAHGTTHHHLP